MQLPRAPALRGSVGYGQGAFRVHSCRGVESSLHQPRSCHCQHPLFHFLTRTTLPFPLPVQTTNLLLQAGAEALRTAPSKIAQLSPLRCVRATGGRLVFLGTCHAYMEAPWLACTRPSLPACLPPSPPVTCMCLPPSSPLHSAIKELHRETARELGVDRETCEEVETLLTQLTQLLVGISIMQVCPRARWYVCHNLW